MRMLREDAPTSFAHFPWWTTGSDSSNASHVSKPSARGVKETAAATGAAMASAGVGPWRRRERLQVE